MRTHSLRLIVLVALCVLGFPGTAPAVAPDPGGDENAALSLPVAGKEFGFNGLFNADGLVDGGPDSATQAGLIRAAGGDAARMPLNWWGVEPQKDVWGENAWARHAAAYTAMLNAGVTPHFTLRAAPPWARDAGSPQSCLDTSWCIYPPARSMLGQWAEFVREVERRFPKATLEIWNEPNSNGQWRTGADPARYAELLASAYDAAKSVNPRAVVMMGGLGASTDPGWIPMRQFLAGAYAANPSLKGHTDAINVHTYPLGRVGAGTKFAQTFQDVRDLRSQYGDTATPIFVSETGVSTTGPDAVSAGDQSILLLRAVRKMLTMSDVDGVLVHTLIDREDYPADSVERGYGVMSAGGLTPAPRRAFCQLSRAAGSVYSACPPLAEIVSGPQGLTNRPGPSFSFRATEPATFRCSLDGAAFAPCSSPTSYPGLADGHHTFAVQAVDSRGRMDPDPVTRSFDLDTQAPETTLDGPSGTISNADPAFWPSTSDDSAHLECSLNDGPYSRCVNPYRPGPLTDGFYKVEVRAVDPAGNADPTPATKMIVVDTKAPTATITSGPDGPTADPTPHFQFTADEARVTFACAFNGRSMGPCAEPTEHYPLGTLSDGDYSFQVMAIDAAGNRSPVVSRSFTVDTHGAITTIGLPPSPTSDATPAFTLSSTDSAATFECRFDDDPFASCGKAVEAPSLADGDHSIEARSIDHLGNTGPTTWRAFTVDTVAPRAIITDGPADVVGRSAADFSFYADERGARTECSADGGAFRDCTSPFSMSGLGDGEHSFRVRAIDTAGNVQPAPTARAFTVDTTGPVSTITSGPSGPTQQVMPTFTFSASEEGSTFECRFDSDPFGPCSGNISHAAPGPFGEGPHTFAVRATDRFGNLGAPATRAFRVDLTAPEPPTVTLKNARRSLWLSEPVAAFKLASGEIAPAYTCNLDATTWAPCSATPRYGDLAEGQHMLYVRVTDPAGNVSTITSTKANVDLTAPDTHVVLSATKRRAPSYSFLSSEPGGSFLCSVDHRRFHGCSSPWLPRHLHAGRHRVRVAAVDAAGNRDPLPARKHFRVRR